MVLTPTSLQYDALAEVINIAFGRTAASLSELTHQRVLVEAPSVKIYTLSELPTALREHLPEQVVTVHQLFLGQMAGDALLLFDDEGARLLVGMMLEDDEPVPALDLCARDILVEVGNILLSACLSVFGNLLEVPLTFSVPAFERDSLQALLGSLRVRQEGLSAALMIITGFRTRDSDVRGYLVIVLGVTSLDRLMQAVDTLQ